MPEELDTAAMFAGLILIGVLGLSAALWIVHFQRTNFKFSREAHVQAWPIGWVNFGIFLCALVCSVLIAQVFGGELIRLIDSGGESQHIQTTNDPIEPNANTAAEQLETDPTEALPKLTPWTAVAAILLLQLPLIATFYGLRRYYPKQFAGHLNTHALSIWQVIRQALPLFIRYLPIIWMVNFAWSGLLTFLQSLGLIDEFPPQALIQLFAEGGDPVAMTLLVVFAVLLAPLVEETIFRGGIYRFLKSETTVLPAQILSGSVFALMHANLMSFLPLVVVGILLARVYERSGNILVPMCFHACFNGFSLVMLYVMSYSSIPIGQ